jgi:hypothetical protein
MRLNLYMAEQVQMLEGGKVMAIGLFTDRVVLVGVPPNFKPDKSVPMGVPLGFIACLADVEADETVTVYPEILSPGGQINPHLRVNPVSVKLTAGRGHNVFFRFEPLLMHEPGVHHLRLRFEDGREFTESFELRLKPTEGLRVDTVRVGAPDAAESGQPSPASSVAH